MRDPYFQPAPSKEQREAMAQGWQELLGRFEWDWFVTLTFRPRRGKAIGSRSRLPHPEACDKLFRVWISRLNRHLYGNRWWKKGIGVGWARASEAHKSGAIHYHVLLCGTGIVDARRLDWKDEWMTLAGFARIEQPKSSAAVQAYCSKYVAKDGQIDLGGAALQAPRQPSLAYTASPASRTGATGSRD